MDIRANTNTSSYQLPDQLIPTIFRAYDIRGLVGPELNADVFYALGLGIGSEALDQAQQDIVVGRDGRLSGPELTKALCEGILAAGANVIFIGQVPSPVMYFATHYLPCSAGMIVTGSHNPAAYNGLKMIMGGKTLTSNAIQNLYQRILEKRFHQGRGRFSEVNIIPAYLQTIEQRVQLERPLRIVVDCGNGVAAETAPALYRALGCEVIELYCEVDGHFPNHHPDPSDPNNLLDLIARVKETQADCGLAFDGDADRLGLVTNQGEIIWPDRQMMLFAKDVLSREPNSSIVFDVKCSSGLSKIISAAGGVPLMWKTGHSLIKAKMAEISSPLAGEMSGHIFFKEEWFGFDDGVYAGARFLKILSKDLRPMSEIFQTLPNSVNTPELKLAMADDAKQAFLEKFAQEADFGSAERITIDGLRVDFGYGWGLIRVSNTTPCLTMRFEADTEENLQKITTIFKQQLLKQDSSLEVPF